LSYDEAEEFLDDGQYEAALDKFSESMLLSPVKVKTSENKGDDLHLQRINLMPTKLFV